MFFKGKRSQSMEVSLGLEDGQLKTCGEKPNCISSSAEPGTKFYYPPIEADNIEVIWDNLNILLKDLGYSFEENSSDKYIHATAKTKIMGFVDDLEFLLSEDDSKIFVRSESRVGYSDMGKNRKRMDSIIKQLLK